MPARKMLMPSRTLKGIVTTPYAPGCPYSTLQSQGGTDGRREGQREAGNEGETWVG